eukprot:COSAG02_NODE_425_length_22574_cov_29.550300_3_plen_258_part_00
MRGADRQLARYCTRNRAAHSQPPSNFSLMVPPTSWTSVTRISWPTVRFSGLALSESNAASVRTTPAATARYRTGAASDISTEEHPTLSPAPSPARERASPTLPPNPQTAPWTVHCKPYAAPPPSRCLSLSLTHTQRSKSEASTHLPPSTPAQRSACSSLKPCALKSKPSRPPLCLLFPQALLTLDKPALPPSLRPARPPSRPRSPSTRSPTAPAPPFSGSEYSNITIYISSVINASLSARPNAFCGRVGELKCLLVP